MLQQAIEEKRKELIATAKKYGLNSEKTIKHSQELDKLMNHYWRLKKKSKRNSLF